MRVQPYGVGIGAVAALVLAACGGGNAPYTESSSDFLQAQGQVTIASGTPSNVSSYAAARFLEQASWGPTAAAVEDVKRLGASAWIDQQLQVPPSVLTSPQFVIEFDINNRVQHQRADDWFDLRFYDAAVGGPDQLRQRVNWALYNFITVGRNGPPYQFIEYYNMLQRHSLGSFKDLLREVTLHPTMGSFLNNNQNVADRPNENYARELMQLFSIGLVMLNPDGTVKRSAQGAPLETYSQQDVIQATKALSGWGNVPEKDLPSTNNGNFGKRMIPKTWNGAHSKDEKRLLGAAIPADQSIEQDLESLLDILVTHPNTAPFVARRLIQSLVTSDPSPEYMTRISKVFVDSKGDLGRVVKAILLDPEARAGDNPGKVSARTGKIKEPLLLHVQLLRGLGCRFAVPDKNDSLRPYRVSQRPQGAPNVFGFFPPNHKTPETQNPAPEQKLLTANELRDRTNLSWQLEAPENFRKAGCEIDAFEAAAARSDEALVALLEQRFFRGAMPPTLRYAALNLLKGRLAADTPRNRFSNLMSVLMSTPSMGAIR